MTSMHRSAPKGVFSKTKIVATFQDDKWGNKIITRATAIELVRELFKDMGLHHLRANRYFTNMTFIDVSALANDDLAEAISVGLGCLDCPAAPKHSALNQIVAKRVAAALGAPDGPMAYSNASRGRWAPAVKVY